METGGTFSRRLEAWLADDDAPKTLGALGEVFAEKAFAVTILMLMVLPAVPLPTGGITHVFEGITVVLAAQLVLGRRTLWLPRRWQERELGPVMSDKALPFVVARVQWFERHSRPRGAALLSQRWFRRLLGIVLIAFAAGAALAPPFSGLDTFPAMGAVGVTLGMILEDVVVLAIGVVIGVGGIALIVTIGAAIMAALRDLF